jgi:outer membrane protein OmpA-like peptidoglycan-associated protein
MATERQIGLTAKGIGSFVVSLRSHGLNGILSEDEKRAIFDEVRVRFNLPPEADPERREAHVDAAELELIRADALETLLPHDQIAQPSVALFETDSAVLPEGSRAYLDRLAPTLRPGPGQLLILEGHATDAGAAHGADQHLLAYLRAVAVREYLIESHAFRPDRLEARAWVREHQAPGVATRGVDARLVTPSRMLR